MAHGGGGHGGGGHGGHGGHGHGGGRGRGGPFFAGGPWWGGGGYWDDGYWNDGTTLVVIDPSQVTHQQQASDLATGAMAYIMKLPKAQRAAAYQNIFGRAPNVPLGDVAITMPTWAFVLGSAAALYFLLRK